jgi:hypothetical protein
MPNSTTILINRAPVLTLWATVVAERLGYDRGEALTLGGVVAGLNAHSKGSRLGVFESPAEKAKPARTRTGRTKILVEVCGRDVPAMVTADGVRAVTRGKPVDPDDVQEYLEDKFGDDLKVVRAAMAKVAKSFRPVELAVQAYTLYEQFRPAVPVGKSGWGAKGKLDLGQIQRLVSKT